MEAGGLRRITPGDRVPGPTTPGMVREQALVTDRIWAGSARSQPGTISGWHHHGDWESAIYVVSGSLRMEFGSSGSETFDATPGDFVFVPAGAIHRESNPSDEPADLIVVRSGSGESVVNVVGPPD